MTTPPTPGKNVLRRFAVADDGLETCRLQQTLHHHRFRFHIGVEHFDQFLSLVPVFSAIFLRLLSRLRCRRPPGNLSLESAFISVYDAATKCNKRGIAVPASKL